MERDLRRAGAPAAELPLPWAITVARAHPERAAAADAVQRPWALRVILARHGAKRARWRVLIHDASLRSVAAFTRAGLALAGQHRSAARGVEEGHEIDPIGAYAHRPVGRRLGRRLAQSRGEEGGRPVYSILGLESDTKGHRRSQIERRRAEAVRGTMSPGRRGGCRNEAELCPGEESEAGYEDGSPPIRGDDPSAAGAQDSLASNCLLDRPGVDTGTAAVVRHARVEGVRPCPAVGSELRGSASCEEQKDAPAFHGAPPMTTRFAR